MKQPNKKLFNYFLGRPALLIFLSTWFAYGAAINSSNLTAFDLQQIGVEAMVERHHFYLEGSPSPHMQTKGDVFEYGGHKYAAKQPGQFMSGAIVYFVLNKLGLNYADHYLITSALVTFFTTSLILALSVVALFGIAREMAAHNDSLPDGPRKTGLKTPRFWTLAAALSYGLATTAFAYSGIAHHDAIATGYLVIGFYLILRVSSGNVTRRAAYSLAAGAGFLLGLTITASMLPFFMVLVCAAYFFWLRRWQLSPVFLIGLFAGLLPLFIYDAVSFGNPLLLPNIAGHYSDTYFHLSATNFGNKTVFYAKALILYVPLIALGLFGFSYFPTAQKRESHFLTLFAMMTVLVLYVFNIGTDGDCQFGPRYLLPAMPFACLGIMGFSYLSRSTERRLAAIAVMLSGVYSFVVNQVGALRGAMFCKPGENAFWNHLATWVEGESLTYPLGPWLLLPLLICTALLIVSLANGTRARSGFRNAS